MRRVALVLFAALIGCGSPDERGDVNAMVDAATHDETDAPGISLDAERTPFTTTGTTPAGSLDDVRFMSVEYVGGHCPGTYYLKLYRTDAPEDGPVATFGVTIALDAPRPVTGTVAASGWAAAMMTDEGTFEIVQLDAPLADDLQTTMVRIAGRMSINTAGWNVDFEVDATMRNKICLIQ